MADLFLAAGNELKSLAEKHEAVLVGYSGGKESCVILDLATKFFKRVVAYHLYLVPGLRYTEERLAFARSRWKVDFLTYPSSAFLDACRNWWYCDPRPEWCALPDWNADTFHKAIQRQTGIPLILNGARLGDYRNRRRQVQGRKKKDVVYPIRDWAKAHVAKYLLVNGIPLPPSDGRVSTSVNLTARSLLWLARDYPDDFERVAKFFPYVRTQVYRQKFFGVSA